METAPEKEVVKEETHAEVEVVEGGGGGGGGGGGATSRFVRRSGIFLNGTFFGAGQNGTNRDILSIKNVNIKHIVSFYHHCTTRLSSEQFSYQEGWQGDVWLSLANYTQGFKRLAKKC